ncbi:interleukin-6 [Sagmatias obliquidens]|uniref:Interleukin-6 n=1 Tax=Tursiops truncatus TaxID=9739 RepID=A0A2U3V9U5_TURTR|nr:interleukin-6 [Tursiops truncatus]XP_026958461.1 interleukin-6 [Lagenorhynchus obliquidens]XP_030712927.1 interleukin-6 [Globicephala melas]XP_059875850.1 interleukin-6 isoform X2 [Delphinus delphis]
MNSLSTIAFSLGLLLVTATAFPTPGPLGEDFKDDTTSDRLLLTSPDKTEALIKYILGKISAMRKEMCEKYDKCENSKEALAENNLNLPKMAEKDGCFQSGFNQETCLMRITTGLLEYQIYLDYLQNEYEGDKGSIEAVQISSKALAQILRQKVKNPDEVTTPDPTTNASLMNNLQSQNDDWMKNTKIILILRSLENFLQFSLRAIRIK